MLQITFGLVWLILAIYLLLTRQALAAQGRDVTILVAFAGLLAVYNFLRGGISWLRRRRRDRSEPED